ASSRRSILYAARPSWARLPVLIDSRSKARPPSRIGRASATIPKRPNPTIAGGVTEVNYGDDCDQYFQRKSQIFALAPASGAAYVDQRGQPGRKQPREQNDFRS